MGYRVWARQHDNVWIAASRIFESEALAQEWALDLVLEYEVNPEDLD